MELRILSLNVRLWTKENNIFRPHFWLWRTFKQARLFRRENPDIICLQEVQKPVGKFLLKLWKYKGFFTDTRLPIYIKKKVLHNLSCQPYISIGGKSKHNGHGTNVLGLYNKFIIPIHNRHGISALGPYNNFITPIHIQNCHYSWQLNEIRVELLFGYSCNTIFCGDTNVSKDRFISLLDENKELVGPYVIYPKIPEGPTYVSYGEPLKYRGDIDQFGYVGKNPPKAKVTILPDKVSDHFPILATIEI